MMHHHTIHDSLAILFLLLHLLVTFHFKKILLMPLHPDLTPHSREDSLDFGREILTLIPRALELASSLIS